MFPRRWAVNITGCKYVARPGVTTTAGLRQIGPVHGRAGILGRQDIVKSVAGGAIGYTQIPSLGRQSVISVHVG